MASPKQSMSSILSGEPLPIPPPQDDVEQDAFNHSMVNYLRRLSGQFTTQNMPDASAEQVDEWGQHIFLDDVVTPDEFVLWYAGFDCTLNSFTHIGYSSPSTTLTLKIDGVACTGSGDNTLSTSVGTFTLTGANTVTAGAAITIHSSAAISSDGAMSITVKRTRT